MTESKHKQKISGKNILDILNFKKQNNEINKQNLIEYFLNKGIEIKDAKKISSLICYKIKTSKSNYNIDKFDIMLIEYLIQINNCENINIFIETYLNECFENLTSLNYIIDLFKICINQNIKPNENYNLIDYLIDTNIDDIIKFIKIKQVDIGFKLHPDIIELIAEEYDRIKNY